MAKAVKPSARHKAPVVKRPRAVTPEIAQHICYSYLVGDNHLGVDGGGFVNLLIATISKADPENRELLRRTHPGYVAAVEAVRETWGVDWLRNLARSAA